MSKALDKGKALRYGWQALKKHFLFIMSLQVVMYAVAILVFLLFFKMVSNDVQEFIIQIQDKSLPWPYSLAILILSGLLFLWVQLNWCFILLKIKDKGKANFQDIKMFPLHFLESIGMGLVFIGFFILFVGTWVSLLPYTKPTYSLGLFLIMIASFLYAIARTGFVFYFFVDKNYGVTLPIKKSIAVTQGQVFSLLFLMFILLIISCTASIVAVSSIVFSSFMQLIVSAFAGFVWVDAYRQLKPARG